MSSTKFLSSLPFVLRWEGGFVDHPNDPGGRTNKGVTQKVYDKYRLSRAEPAQDVKLIVEREVNEIYEAGYWMAAQCERLDLPLHLVQFDTAVNMGVTRAIRFLQQAVNCALVDGDFGPGTAKALAACDQGTAVVRYCEIREEYYRRLAEKDAKLAVFLKGWLNRLNSLRTAAGIPGFESAKDVSFGDADFIFRIPDVGEDDAFDLQ